MICKDCIVFPMCKTKVNSFIEKEHFLHPLMAAYVSLLSECQNFYIQVYKPPYTRSRLAEIEEGMKEVFNLK